MLKMPPEPLGIKIDTRRIKNSLVGLPEAFRHSDFNWIFAAAGCSLADGLQRLHEAGIAGDTAGKALRKLVDNLPEWGSAGSQFVYDPLGGVYCLRYAGAEPDQPAKKPYFVKRKTSNFPHPLDKK